MGEVLWLDPYPDLLIDGLTDPAPGPESRYEAREAISLAFVTALQLLPPRQRVVLVLRDVLGFRASEVALMLETTEESVTSALKRARVVLKRRLAESDSHEPAPAQNSPVEQELVERLTLAYESDDLDGLVALLSEDVWLRMPPIPMSTKDANSFVSSSPRWLSVRAGHIDSSRPGPTLSRPSASTSATRALRYSMQSDSLCLPWPDARSVS